MSELLSYYRYAVQQLLHVVPCIAVIVMLQVTSLASFCLTYILCEIVFEGMSGKQSTFLPTVPCLYTFLCKVCNDCPLQFYSLC